MIRKFNHWLGQLKVLGGRVWWHLDEQGRRIGHSLCQVWYYVSTWWQWCNGRYLLQGLPAVLLGFGVVLVAVLVVLNSKVDLISDYQEEASEAVSAGNHALAKIAYERLVLLDESRPEYPFRLAQSEESLGHSARAWAILSSLAPVHEPGYAPAHFELARKYAARAESSPQARQLAEFHLLQAVRGQPPIPEAHALLGQLYLMTNRPELAEPQLLKAQQSQPDIALVLAGIYRDRGQKDQADIWAQRAARVFREKVETDTLDHAARMNWAESVRLLGKYDSAVSILQQGLALSPTDGYRSRLARVYSLWANSIGQETAPQKAERLVLLEEGLKYDPGYPDLLLSLVQLARTHAPEAAKARLVLLSLLDQGKASATLHLFLGMDALERGKYDEAKLHFDQAYRLNPQMPLVGNNLAWVLATSEPPDLPRALNLINAVLEQYPRDPRFRQTRGQILARMGKWEESHRDLEFSLPSFPNSPVLHRTLAEAYQHLGMPAMAEQHRRLAQKAP